MFNATLLLVFTLMPPPTDNPPGSPDDAVAQTGEVDINALKAIGEEFESSLPAAIHRLLERTRTRIRYETTLANSGLPTGPEGPQTLEDWQKYTGAYTISTNTIWIALQPIADSPHGMTVNATIAQGIGYVFDEHYSVSNRPRFRNAYSNDSGTPSIIDRDGRANLLPPNADSLRGAFAEAFSIQLLTYLDQPISERAEAFRSQFPRVLLYAGHFLAKEIGVVPDPSPAKIESLIVAPANNSSPGDLADLTLGRRIK